MDGYARIIQQLQTIIDECQLAATMVTDEHPLDARQLLGVADQASIGIALMRRLVDPPTPTADDEE